MACRTKRLVEKIFEQQLELYNLNYTITFTFQNFINKTIQAVYRLKRRGK